MTLGDWIQLGAVLAAVGASIVALLVSYWDRKGAQAIAAEDRKAAALVAAEDRRASLEQSKLMFDLEALLRLLENLNRGGSTDPQESQRMGAEALSLIGLLGPDLLPRQWKHRVNDDSAGLAGFLEDPECEQWRKNSIEAQIAVNTVTEQIRQIVNRQAA